MLGQGRAGYVYGREEWDEDVCGGRNGVMEYVVGRGEMEVTDGEESDERQFQSQMNCCW